ncbi:hypothetical protein [Dactylosporangium sp. NPDC051541]|uniref:hypothetical protein n=1 Tax=Dactylosporangium sp. NPDC051541 TaxID=3363977 RepID=UPI0037AD6FEF
MTAAPITWWQDDEQRLLAECVALAAAAPDLRWEPKGPGYWRGAVPLWPFDRPQPEGLPALVGGRPLEVAVLCRPPHPMVPPIVVPYSVTPPTRALGYASWHLLPSGALCLVRGTAWWDPQRLIASLVPKISGWYIEFQLMMAGLLDEMPARGVDRDDGLDALIDRAREPAR